MDVFLFEKGKHDLLSGFFVYYVSLISAEGTFPGANVFFNPIFASERLEKHEGERRVRATWGRDEGSSCLELSLHI